MHIQNFILYKQELSNLDALYKWEDILDYYYEPLTEIAQQQYENDKVERGTEGLVY